MAEFFSSRLLKLLTVPYRTRLADAAARPFYYVADRVLGTKFLEQIAEFFILFQTLSDGFVSRAKEVERLLADGRTTFVVVSNLEPVPAKEAQAFMRLLPARGLHAGALVLNRVLPPYMMDAALAGRADELSARAGELAALLCAAAGPLEGFEPASVERVLKELGANFDNVAVLARREAAQRAELSRLPSVVADVPELGEDVHNLAGVLEVGHSLWGS
jgi:anion-transporting  ArsA/GET3 family ATPase